MRVALRRALLGRHASPNPMVGCVIASPSGQIVGRGFHPEPGAPHAEIFALVEAGDLAKGGVAYVTLEPCSHFGRTPPCAGALIRAGVAKVVIAMLDPDRRVSGQGAERLRAAGIAVEVGLLEAQARNLNRAYVKHRETGLPYVTVKTATTLDGKIATPTGDSKWITSAVTRRWAHRRLRDRVDAIMVGIGTVRRDDPSLTTRLFSRTPRNPVRVVVDTHLDLPLSSKLATPGALPGETWVAAAYSAPLDRRNSLEQRGVKIVDCSAGDDGRVDLADLLAKLGTAGITHLLLEGGGELIGSALRGGHVDRYVATIAPKIIGGAASPGPAMGAPISNSMNDALSPKSWIMRRCGSDIVIECLLKD